MRNQHNLASEVAIVLGGGISSTGIPNIDTLLRAEAGVKLAKARADLDAAAKEARLHAERTAGRGPTDTGGYTMWMRTTKAAGLRFNTAWDLAMGEIQAERTAAGLAPLTYGQLCADALTRVADKSLTSPDGSGSTDGSRGPGRPAQRGILFADIAALQHGVAQGDETCQIPGVGTISVPTARDLLGDATLTLVIRDGIDVRNVTNLGPTFTAAQRTAIWARAGGVCERPDCNTTTGLSGRDPRCVPVFRQLGRQVPFCHRPR